MSDSSNTQPPGSDELDARLRAAAQEHKRPNRHSPWPFVAAGALAVIGGVGLTVGLTSRGNEAGASVTTTSPKRTTECTDGAERGQYESRQICYGGHWVASGVPRPEPTTQAPTTSAPPTTTTPPPLAASLG